MTISRRLNEVGFNSKKYAKKPLFPAIKVLKLAWPIFLFTSVESNFFLIF